MKSNKRKRAPPKKKTPDGTPTAELENGEPQPKKQKLPAFNLATAKQRIDSLEALQETTLTQIGELKDRLERFANEMAKHLVNENMAS